MQCNLLQRYRVSKHCGCSATAVQFSSTYYVDDMVKQSPWGSLKKTKDLRDFLLVALCTKQGHKTGGLLHQTLYLDTYLYSTVMHDVMWCHIFCLRLKLLGEKLMARRWMYFSDINIFLILKESIVTIEDDGKKMLGNINLHLSALQKLPLQNRYLM